MNVNEPRKWTNQQLLDHLKEHADPPEGIERELLTCMAEECMEVGKNIMKALRFGLEEHPPGSEQTNLQRVSDEIGDMLCLVDFLLLYGLIDEKVMHAAMKRKEGKMPLYMLHWNGGKSE